jgi:hypothetical protein
MRSCCRPRGKSAYAEGDPTACRELEGLGAGLTVWVMNVRGTYQLVLKRPSGEFVTVVSFLSTYGCKGPTASLLRSNLDRVTSAAAKNPTAIQKFASSGTSLVQLFKAVDGIVRTTPNTR